MNKLNRNTGNLIMCITEAVIGILLLINPIGFTSGIIIALGVVLTLLGAKALVGYFKADAETASESSGLAKGLLLAVSGIFCMFKAEWFIITKIQWAVDMYRQKQSYWYIEVLGAVLTILFAILILTNPFASTAILWTFIGISLIAEAIIDILAFVLGRK